LELIPENLLDVGQSLIEREPAQFCRRTIDATGWAGKAPLVIEGLRHEQIVPYLRQLVSPHHLIRVHIAVPREVRQERVEERGDEIDLAQVEAHAAEVQVNSILAEAADLSIDGTLTPDDICSKVIAHLSIDN
jgi:hypothetical protein